MIVFLFVLLIIILLFLAIYFSKINIKVNNFEFFSGDLNSEVLKYDIVIKIIILNILPVFRIKLNPEIFRKKELKKELNKSNKNSKIGKIKNNFEMKIADKIKNKIQNRKYKQINEIIQGNRKIKVEVIKKILKEVDKLSNNLVKKVDMNINIGTENAATTSIIVPVISTIIAIYFRNKIKDIKKQKFNISPVYINKNLINIELKGIFELRLRHIISIILIYILSISKGEIKNGRTSHRRTYGYSYE